MIRIKKFMVVSILILVLFTFFVNSAFCLPKIDQMTIATDSANGTWLRIGAAVADKVNEHFEGYPITSVPGSGSVGNAALVGSGKNLIGVSMVPWLLLAFKGEGPYEEALPDLRLIATFGKDQAVHIILDLKKEISTLEELLSKKIPVNFGIPAKGSASFLISNLIFNKCGYESPDVINNWGGKVYYAEGIANVDNWRDRHINAAFLTYNVPSTEVEQCLLGRPGKVLSLGENVIEKLVSENGFSRNVIPAGTYPQQEEDVETIGLKQAFICNTKLPDEVAYQIAKTLYEDVDFLANVSQTFKGWDRETMTESAPIPFHEGAIKFYKEVGLMK